MRSRIISTRFRRHSPSSSSTSSSANSNGAALPTATPIIIQRHGPSDGVITLDVGGTKFRTLRSTVAHNAVLMDHVARAEANSEMSVAGGSASASASATAAIFVDRDPKHFGMILTYLRNRADGVHGYPTPTVVVARRLNKFGNKGKGNGNGNGNGNGASSSDQQSQAAQTVTSRLTKSMSTTIASSSLVQLPKDSKTLTEMYFESVHYDIPELTGQICSQQSLTRIFGLFGSGNPFKMASTAAVFGRRALVLFGTVAASAGTWAYGKATAVQDRANEFVESSREGESNGAEFWKSQTELWNGVAEKWNGSGGQT